MKCFPLFLATLLAAGCAVNRPLATSPQSPRELPQADAPDYQPCLACALVFDSAVMPSFPLLGLDRSSREPSAFLGYDQSVTETFFIFTDDNQNIGPWQDSYSREAIYAKSGTRSR